MNLDDLPRLRRITQPLLLSLLLCLAAYCPVQAADTPPLTLKVMTVSEASLYANMTLVMGQHEAALIDVPFTRADGHRVVADILDSGKTLKYVYITHDHPDHFMSLEVIADAFPDAKLITAPAVVNDIWRSLPLKLKRWGPMLGANGPKRPVVPVAWEQPSFEIEGRELQILGPMQGDHKHATAIWIPSLKALIAGDLVFDQLYPWLGEHTAADRQAWLASLDTLSALQPQIVVAGHQVPGRPHDPGSIAFTRDYLKAFEAGIKTSRNSAELANRMRAAFPRAQDVLGGFLLSNSTQVAMGEAPPWDE